MTEIFKPNPQNPLRNTSYLSVYEVENGAAHKRPLLSSHPVTKITKILEPSAKPVSYENQNTLSQAQKNLKDTVSSLPKAPFLPAKSYHHREMKTLVLDMDETLLHASTKSISRADSVIKLSDGTKFFVLKRPHLDEFLEQLSKLYEIVIYTAGGKEYASTIIDEIDKSRHISYILHRDHCLRCPTGAGKDLSLIGRNLKEIVFIDNLEENLRKQRENGLKILDFYDNTQDTELKKLIPFLQYVSGLDDVRPIKKIYADFLTKELRKPQLVNSETKQRAESSKGQRIPQQRKDSAVGALNTGNSQKAFNKIEGNADQTTTELGYYLKTPIKKEVAKNQSPLSKTQIFSPQKKSVKPMSQSRVEEAINPLRYRKSIPSYKIDHSIRTGKQQSTILNNIVSNSDNNQLIPSEDQLKERALLGKQSIVYFRESESGVLIGASNQNLLNSPAAMRDTESSPLLEDLCERINRLEQKLKTKCFK